MRALRYLAVKGNHAPTDILAKVAELDRDLQEERCKKVQSTFEAELARFAEQRLKAEATAGEEREETEETPTAESTDEKAEEAANDG